MLPQAQHPAFPAGSGIRSRPLGSLFRPNCSRFLRAGFAGFDGGLGGAGDAEAAGTVAAFLGGGSSGGGLLSCRRSASISRSAFSNWSCIRSS